MENACLYNIKWNLSYNCILFRAGTYMNIITSYRVISAYRPVSKCIINDCTLNFNLQRVTAYAKVHFIF